MSARQARLCLTAIALCVVAFGIANDFVYDDAAIVRDNALLHSLANWRAIVGGTYWPSPFVEQLHRPLASLTLAVQYAIGDGSPLPFRIVSGLLYLWGTIAVYSLACRLVSPAAAFCAAALFASHPVHVEAVAQAVNQGELIVGLAAARMVSRYVDGRRAGRLLWRDWGAMGAWYLVAVGFKESGYVIPGLIVAAELTVLRAAPSSQIREIAAGTLVLGGVAVAAIAARSSALAGHVQGAVPFASLRGLDLYERILTMLQVVPHWVRLLAWPARLRADYTAADFPPVVSAGSTEALVVLAALALAAVTWTTRRRVPVFAFGVLWITCGLLPVSNLVPTGIMLADRTLYLPSIGFVIAVAGLGSALAASSAASDARRSALFVGCAALVAAGMVKSANRLSLWNSASLIVTGDSARETPQTTSRPR
ncbi:MAG: glycosyltransferase family 39 protein [Gemmatimonadota bacterium]|nr:glycosyltransferase family 39 protein [Gemmatimonadota bacterium]